MRYTKIILLGLLLLMIPTAYSYQFDIVSTNPNPAESGEYVDITFNLNHPESMQERRTNVSLRLGESEEIVPLSTQQRTYTQILPGQTITRTFTAYIPETVPNGDIPIELVVQDDRQTTTKQSTLYVEGGPRDVDLEIGKVSSTPEELLIDTDQNTLDITLQNLGEDEADLLKTTLKGDGLEESYLKSLEDSISSLPGGEQKQLQFDFDIEDDIDNVINADLTARYRVQDDRTNTYVQEATTLPLNLSLTSHPDIEIINSDPLNTFQTDSSGNELQLTVRNEGREDGENVRLRLYPDPNVPFDFEQTNIFVSSNLETGENTSVIIPFDINADTPLRTYDVNVEFESLVGDNRYGQDASVSFDVVEEAGLSTTTIAIALLVLAVLLAVTLGYFYNREK